MNNLKYLEVYDVIINNRECKGIYLGEFGFGRVKKYREMILINWPNSLYDFHLKKFSNSNSFFEKGKLHLGRNYPFFIPNKQWWFYEELLEEKGISKISYDEL